MKKFAIIYRDEEDLVWRLATKDFLFSAIDSFAKSFLYHIKQSWLAFSRPESIVESLRFHEVDCNKLGEPTTDTFDIGDKVIVDDVEYDFHIRVEKNQQKFVIAKRDGEFYLFQEAEVKYLLV